MGRLAKTWIKVITVADVRTKHEIELPSLVPTLRDIRKAVTNFHNNGAVLEPVTVITGSGLKTLMFIEEDALARGLERNERATQLYRNAWLKAHPEVDPESVPDIHGDVIVFLDGHGEDY